MEPGCGEDTHCCTEYVGYSYRGLYSTILDVEVLSSFCHGCSSKKGYKSEIWPIRVGTWLEEHKKLLKKPLWFGR